MRKLTLSILASAATFAISTSASAQTVEVGQGPNFTTHISASTSNTQNNNVNVYGSTTGVGGSDVLFTGNTPIHITDGNGFAAISDSTNPADTGAFTSLIIDVTSTNFTALEFNLSLDTASYLQVDYSYGGNVFTNADVIFQGANANTGYTIFADAGTSFDAIRLTTCATSTGCNTAMGVGSGTGSAINLERQNSIGIQLAPTVPEPATWAMMLVGFGAAGVSLRRRRKVTALQAA